MRGTYTRWTMRPGSRVITADILSSNVHIESDPETATTTLVLIEGDVRLALRFNPDEARMIGVRLIEGAALSDPGAVRELP